MNVVFARKAAKALSEMPAADAVALVAKIEEFAAAPTTRHSWTKAFGADEGRIRQGDWRAVYRIDRRARLLLVEAVGHRKEVYR
jgi:mRNA-degrading endonuclease RelE of RelBE toxin-antitoxin system